MDTSSLTFSIYQTPKPGANLMDHNPESNQNGSLRSKEYEYHVFSCPPIQNCFPNELRILIYSETDHNYYFHQHRFIYKSKQIKIPNPHHMHLACSPNATNLRLSPKPAGNQMVTCEGNNMKFMILHALPSKTTSLQR